MYHPRENFKEDYHFKDAGVRIPIIPPSDSPVACVEVRYRSGRTIVDLYKINQMGTRIADAIPDTDYLLEQINKTPRTWCIAIEPENISSFIISSKYQKHFNFTCQGWQYIFTTFLKTASVLCLCVIWSLQNISPANHCLEYVMLIRLVSRK